MLRSLRQQENIQSAEAAIQLGNKVNIYLLAENGYDIHYIIHWAEMCIVSNKKGEIINKFMNSFLILFQKSNCMTEYLRWNIQGTCGTNFL